MLSFIANLLRTILFATLLNDYVKRTYPKKYEDFLVTASFNAVYAFSVIQIKIKQVQRYILNANPGLSKLLETYNKTRIKNTIDFILEGKIIFSTTILTPDIDHPKNHDFIIYSDSKSRNKKLLTEVSVDENYDYEMSDIQFMLVELKIGTNTYKIDLKCDSYNFYVVGNCFTKKFFVYYLTEILKPTQQLDNDNKFIIKIIDHDVNSIDFEFTDKNESIMLEKNGYKLLNISNNNEENE
jgi:hypothetical protein